MTPPDARTKDVNWNALNLQVNLNTVDTPLDEEEIQQAIGQLPHDKAPGRMDSPAYSS